MELVCELQINFHQFHINLVIMAYGIKNEFTTHPIKKHHKYNRGDYFDQVFQESSKKYPQSANEI